MTILEYMEDHDLTPYMFEYEGKTCYDPSQDPNYVDFGYLTPQYKYNLDDIPVNIIYMAKEEKKGLTPRVHIFNEDGSFSCCIGLLEAKYYDDNDFESSRLSEKQKQDLIFIFNNIEDKMNFSNWREALYHWYIENDYDDDTTLADNAKMPDYMQL